MRRVMAVIGVFLSACLSVPVWADVPSPTRLEQEVLAILNAARADPVAYAGSLKTYRTFFKANIVVMPGRRINYQTVEGVMPVNEAMTYLASQTAQGTLEFAPVLAAAAADHAHEQSTTGRTGHYSADGSSPGERAVHRGGGPMVAEVIAYGPVDAADVVRQLIVDDGVPDRGHRTVMFSRQFRFAGVSCGPHPEFRTMCVIDMADTPDGQPATMPLGSGMRIASRGRTWR